MLSLDPREHKWLESQEVKAIFTALQAAGGQVRVVGGAVRDALLGRSVHDIDFATTLPPESIVAALEKAGIKAVPTGIEHGTITAVIDHKGYEITTLRRDVETDGRHAKVAFTDDWQADAARRDFTFNALYADQDGVIYDYFDGQADLKTRCIRFIGDPAARIGEDVLRILRAFRFMAQLSDVHSVAVIEPKSLQACRMMAGSLPSLSAERVWHELLRLLTSWDPVPAWQLMIEGGILNVLAPKARNIEGLQRIVAVERDFVPPSAIRRLAALWAGEMTDTAVRALRLSRRDGERLLVLHYGIFDDEEEVDRFVLRQKLYDYGADIVRDGLLMLAARAPLSLPDLFVFIDEWKNPVLPLSGKDLSRLGVMPGPQMGKIIDSVEKWWRMKDFVPDHDACIKEAKKYCRINNS